MGKLMLLKLRRDWYEQQGGKPSLRAFHDYVWKNGNVPLSLLRWEHLFDRRDVDRLTTLK